MRRSSFKLFRMQPAQGSVCPVDVMVKKNKLRECFLLLVRYVPDVVRGESLNIGLFLHSPEQNYLGCRFIQDFRRIKQFHPAADVELLRELQGHFEQEIRAHKQDLAGYISRLEGSYSNMIQVTTPKPCQLRDPEREIDDLFDRYVDRPGSRPSPGRRRAHETGRRQ